MIKGGFQGLDISGVDLTAQSPTLPGGYATCQAADGKTIRVLTADGVVQCSIKKVSANYVLAGITGDGKILSITIGSTDGISVSETTPGTAEETEKYLDAAVQISSATSSTPYITEYDGIIRLAISTTTSSSDVAAVNIKTGATHAGVTSLFSLPLSASKGERVSCFVKKGSIIYCSNINGTDATLDFHPYKPVQS